MKRTLLTFIILAFIGSFDLLSQTISTPLNDDVGINLPSGSHFSDAALHIRASQNNNYTNGGQQFMFLQTVNGTQDNFRIFNILGNSADFTPTLMGTSTRGPKAALYLASNISTQQDISSGPATMIFAALNGYSPNTSQETQSTGVNVKNRDLFQWRNNETKLMTMSAIGNLGLGTENPTAQLHTTSNVRHQNLAFRSSVNYYLGVDTSGNVFRTSVAAGGIGCTNNNYLVKSAGSLGGTCSQVYDNSTNVGIGTSSPSSKLTVNGDIRSLTNTFLSDKKFKKDIKPIEKGLDVINELEPVSYYWDKTSDSELNFDDNLHSGVIAQEIQKVLPHLVNSSSESLSVNYTEIIPYLIKSIQELSAEVESLKNGKVSNLSQDMSIELKLVPNPTNGQIDLQFNEYLKSELSFQLYDVNSNLKISDVVRKNTKIHKLNISSLPSGIYHYVLSNNGVYHTGKIIKK